MNYYTDQEGNVYAYDSLAEKEAYGPAGLVEMTAEQVDAHINPPKTAEQLEAELLVRYIVALEAHYDAAAQTRRYDNRLTCALRAGYPGPFQAEGMAFAVWMDGCNAYAYGQMVRVKTGERGQPTPAELVAELPALVWP